MDSGHIERPWKVPSALIGLDAILAFVNALFLIAGVIIVLWANWYFPLPG